MVGYIVGDDAARADERPLADGHTGDDHGLRADGSAFADVCAPEGPILGSLQCQVRVDCTWKKIVGETHLRTNEDAVLEVHAFIEQRVVLHLAVFAQAHPGSDVDARADNRATADDGLFADVRLTPDAAALAYGRFGRDLSGRMNERVRQLEFDDTPPMTDGNWSTAAFSVDGYARRVEKPWGYEILLTPNDVPYTAKLIHVKAGKRLSLQLHDTKVETQTLVAGHGVLVLEGADGQLHDIQMQPGVGYHVAVGQRHRLCAAPDADATIFEASTPETGTTLRLEDDYARPHETEAQRLADRSA